MRISNFKLRITNKDILLTFSFFIVLLLASFVSAEDKWGGVDESVVEKYAEEHGRAARDPLINTDQGDLLLFLFLLAGTVGGFIAGYNWRRLGERKSEKEDRG
jgi:ABC-type cobalt transport system substrate-binding protein